MNRYERKRIVVNYTLQTGVIISLKSNIDRSRLNNYLIYIDFANHDIN